MRSRAHQVFFAGVGDWRKGDTSWSSEHCLPPIGYNHFNHRLCMVLGLPKSWQLLRRCSSIDQPGGKSWTCLPDRQPRLCSLQRHSQPPFSSCQSCDLPPPCHPIHPFIHPTGSVRSVPDRNRTVRVPVVQSCPSSASSQLTAKVSEWEWAQTSGLQRVLPTQIPAGLLEIEMLNYYFFYFDTQVHTTHTCT